MENACIFHSDSYNVFPVIKLIFCMMSFKSKILKQLHRILNIICQYKRVKRCNLHLILLLLLLCMCSHPDIPDVLHPFAANIDKCIVRLCVRIHNSCPAEDAVYTILFTEITDRFVSDPGKAF